MPATPAGILVINGPNLDRLGKREPAVYGTETLADIENKIAGRAAERGLAVEFRQSNKEGELVEYAHEAADLGYAVIVNAGAYTHTSIALRDALAEVADGPGFVEVHISNVYAREPFRHRSYLSDRALGVVAGLGSFGYLAAVDFLAGGC